MDDSISRQGAIRWVKTECNPYGKPTLDFESGKRVIEHLENMPSAQPDLDEWCYDCKEYDQERHCCPRWNRVIRKTLEDAQPKIIRCKDCKHRGEDECPMRHVEWVEYEDDGYIDSDDVIYDYTEDNGYCFKAER